MTDNCVQFLFISVSVGGYLFFFHLRAEPFGLKRTGRREEDLQTSNGLMTHLTSPLSLLTSVVVFFCLDLPVICPNLSTVFQDYQPDSQKSCW